MKQGLSLRISQHLALTPQLQQSIRLLQISTLEMAQEVEQMLDDNPFLERDTAEQGYEEALQNEREVAEKTNLDAIDVIAAQAVLTVTSSSGADSTTGSSDAGADSTTDGVSDSSADGSDPMPDNWEGEGSYEFSPDDSEWGGDAPARNNSSAGPSDGDVDATTLSPEHVSLQDHLHVQARSLRLSDVDQAALMFLIESLTDDGYLEDSFEDLAESLGASTLEDVEELVQRFTVVLKLLHHMDPAGVGARHLAECLRLQLDNCSRITPDVQVALKICQQPLDLLARRDTKKLAQVCTCSVEDVKTAIALISRLDPKPGRRFAEVERNVIVPDVLVTALGRGAQKKFRVQLNPDVMPRLKVHDIYANALKGGKSGNHAALQSRLAEARWFIKNIQQRFDTILRVSNAIVERQRNFFVHGALAMRPLVLREIADELGLHESTISRVTTAKYMATPHGTFELKYFFGSALGTETGGNASSTAVRALIAQLVAAENPKKPLSDNALAEMLKEQGIECARRTVAKYREALRISPTHLRKAL